MPSYAVPPRPRPQRVVLGEIFCAGLGWRAPEESAVEVEVHGLRYLLTPLASRPPVTALLCEPPQGVALPGYALRRRVGGRIRRLFPRPLTVFTDAAHSRQVWAWQGREPGGPLVWRELSRAPGADPPAGLGAIVRDLEGALRMAREPPGEGSTGRATLLALLRRVRGLHAEAFRPGGPLAGTLAAGRGPSPRGRRELRQSVQDAIEGAADPRLLRAVWRALEGFTALDPACGGGGWLLSVLEALEPVYGACLERMRGWTDDADRTRGRGPLLRDFRAVLERAGDLREHPSPANFVRESIVLRNLFGAERDPGALAEAELALRLRLGAVTGGSDPPPFAGNLRAGDLGRGFRTLPELRAALPDEGGRRALEEEMETLHRAEQRMRALRLEQGVPAGELLAGLGAVRARREALGAALDRLLARREGIDPADRRALAEWREARRPLHRCAEYFGILRRGGFSLERGAEG